MKHLHTKKLKTGARADDIDDRVQGTDFVKMHGARLDAVHATLGFGQMAVGIVTAFVVAYASIAWLLKYVANHSIMVFVWYRVALGVLLAGALAAGVISAT